jgi:hypothetical protein
MCARSRCLQTFASCFNGGLSGSAAVRRCLTYRNSVSTPVSCPAQFLDFNFAFYGNNGKAQARLQTVCPPCMCIQ